MMKKVFLKKNTTGSIGTLSEETIRRLKEGDKSVLIPAKASPEPTPKMLSIHPERCNGCGLCEIACALFHFGETNKALSRVRVLKWNGKDVYLPVLCQHCADAPCKAVCPNEAISLDEKLGRVVIDYDLCVSCQMCLAACPYGATMFDADREMVFKCDLCDGNPQCVHFCEPKALVYQDAGDLSYQRAIQYAGKIRRY
jgi:carbon-monoxide dehydrogenase iron sulfur subunit